jgi:hypothetical protein
MLNDESNMNYKIQNKSSRQQDFFHLKPSSRDTINIDDKHRFNFEKRKESSRLLSESQINSKTQKLTE